uniref:SSD domain-containing protein n=1 Tax=Parascaris univalens TaxID=6257 RepID=A0A914ZMD5_PARUN
MNIFHFFQSTFTSTMIALRERYISFVLRFPRLLITIIFIVSTALSVFSIWYNKMAIIFDPRIGFETRETPLSNQRLAIQNLPRSAAKSNEFTSMRIKKNASFNITSYDEELASLPDVTVAYDGYGIDSSPTLDDIRGACDQYFALGTFIPYSYIEQLSKIIFRVASFDNLFTLETMSQLCYLDTLIDETLKSSSTTPKNIKSIQIFRSMVLKCSLNNAPQQCFTSIAHQLKNMIFEKKSGSIVGTDPIYVAAVLPIIVSLDGSEDFTFYNALLNNLQQYYSKGELLLVGASFNMKQKLFENFLFSDVLFGLLAILLIIFVIFLYSNSILFTFIVSFMIILSAGVSFFVYTVIFRVMFFPFLNLLAIILIIAVGADDAFLFLYQYRKHKKEMKATLLFVRRMSAEEISSDDEKMKRKQSDRIRRCLNDALSHAAVAMFVTSATTAVAFYANLASKIVVLRCFGIYAGTTMVINYLFVITILPAAILIVDDERSKCCALFLKKHALHHALSNIHSLYEGCVDKIFGSCIPHIVHRLRWILIVFALIIFAISIYAIVKYPGIRLPESNSMQFLRSNHPYEWFDEHSAKLFDFTNGQRLKMNLVAVWGIAPTKTASTLNPSETGSLVVDPLFEWRLSNNFAYFESQLFRLINVTNPKDKAELWLQKFNEWTHSDRCRPQICCNFTSLQHSDEALLSQPLSKCFLQFAEIIPFAPFTDFTLSFVDGPIFDRYGHLLAYFMNQPTRFNLSTVFNEMKPFFEFLASVKRMLNENPNAGLDAPIVLTSSFVTSLYDLLDCLLNGTAISVLISLFVSTLVIILSTFHLIISIAAIFSIAVVVALTLGIVLWCGWTINVVEATIIVLTIGLSFDYSLHVAVGFKLSRNSDFKDVSSTVGVPISLAALSSFLAGLALICAHTQAFFEISVFLMLTTSLSILIAIFLLPSILTIALRQYAKIARV